MTSVLRFLEKGSEANERGSGKGREKGPMGEDGTGGSKRNEDFDDDEDHDDEDDDDGGTGRYGDA